MIFYDREQTKINNDKHLCPQTNCKLFLLAILILPFLASPSFLKAQNTFRIKGRVMVTADEQTGGNAKSALQDADISLLRADSSFIAGMSSGPKGEFEFSNIKKGNYLLKLSSIGYEQIWITLKGLHKDLDMGSIELHRNATLLKGVTVHGQPILRKIDRMVVFPTEDAVRHSHDPYDLLWNMMVPHIRVDVVGKSISADNGGSVQLRINGVKASAEEFMAIPSREIVRIDVIDNPGLKYGDNNVGAVIDVIVKRKTTGGLVSLYTNGSPDVMHEHELDNNVGIKLNHKKSQFGLYYNNYFRRWNQRNSNTDETFHLGDKTIERLQEGLDYRYSHVDQKLSLIYNYSEPDKYLLNIAFYNRFYHRPNDNQTNRLYSRGSENYSYSETLSSDKSYTPSLDVFFNKQIDKSQTFQVDIVGTLINDKTHRLYREYTEKDADLAHILTDVEARKQSVWGEAIYEKTFKPFILSAGIRHYQMHARNAYSGQNPVVSSMNQANSSVFSDLRGNLKPFSYMVSMGMTRSYFKDGDIHHTYYIFTPTLRLGMSPHKYGWLGYTLSVSPSVPSLGSLTNVEQAIDTIQLSKGNPNLKTYRIYDHTLNYTFNNYKIMTVFRVNYSYQPDPIMEYYYVQDGKLVCTESNQKSYRSFKAVLFFDPENIRLGRDLKFSGEYYVGFRRFWSDGLTYRHTYSKFNFGLTTLLTYKDLTFYERFMTPENSLFGETITKSPYSAETGLIYTHKQLQLRAQVLYPFTNFRRSTERVSAIAPSQSTYYLTQLKNLFSVTFAYHFEFGKKFKERTTQTKYRDTDSGVLNQNK